MTVFLFVTFSPLLLEDDYLLTTNLVKNLSLNEGILNGGFAQDNPVTILNKQNFVELNFSLFTGVKSVDEDFLTFLYLELLSCNLYYCVHFILCLRFSVRRTHIC